jgi:hypothetical protein
MLSSTSTVTTGATRWSPVNAAHHLPAFQMLPSLGSGPVASGVGRGRGAGHCSDLKDRYCSPPRPKKRPAELGPRVVIHSWAPYRRRRCRRCRAANDERLVSVSSLHGVLSLVASFCSCETDVLPPPVRSTVFVFLVRVRCTCTSSTSTRPQALPARRRHSRQAASSEKAAASLSVVCP